MIKYLNIYLSTSEKDFDEDDKTVFYLTQEVDLTDCERKQRVTPEKRFKTRFEAALVNVGEAVTAIAECLEVMEKGERENIVRTIYLRNDIIDDILTGEHFDIYEMIRFPRGYKTLRGKILLNYGDIKIKWFDKIVDLAQKYFIKFGIANTTSEQYKQDKKKLDNFRADNQRVSNAREVREEKGIEFVFKHLKGRKDG